MDQGQRGFAHPSPVRAMYTGNPVLSGPRLLLAWIKIREVAEDAARRRRCANGAAGQNPP